MVHTHSPERSKTPADRCSSDPFETVLHHLIAIEDAAAARRRKAREAERQLELFDRQLKLF